MVIYFLVFLCGILSLSQSLTVTPGSPIKAIYVDWHLNWNAPQQTVLDAVNAGYNVVIISFYLSGGTAADMAQAWEALDDGTKQSTISTAHSAGAVVTVSLGGSTDSPYDKDAYTLGVQVAKWAVSQYLDGVDFDLENLAQGFKAGQMSDVQTVDWIANLTAGAYAVLGSGGVISHAPQSPYFGPIGDSSTWTGPTGGYSSVYKQVPNYITYFNVQFYNQGASCYIDYNSLFITSANCPNFPKTAVMEIYNNGTVPLSKIVVGKPVTTADAGSGWVSASDLSSFFQQAGSQLGWKAGVMGWVWNDQATLTTWIQTIYGSGGSSGGVTASTASTAATVTISSSSSTSSSSSSSSSSTTGAATCAGKASGMYCANSTYFYWCPSGIAQECAPGTDCITEPGNSIECA